jgi:putative MATE family efflux protein
MRKTLQLIWEALQGKEQSYTTGSINRAILLLSVPMILEMVMESLFALIDAFFVSRVSVEAVATVGLTETVITLIYSIAIGMSMAATAMIARRVGEGKPEAAAVAAVQSIGIVVVMSVIFAVVGFIFAEDILRLMGAEESVVQSGRNYTRILFSTNIVIMLLFLLNGIFRGAGDALYAMAALWIANIINIILDPLLIFGIGPFPEMGVTGAAVATSIGRGTGVAFQVLLLLRGRGIIKIARRHLKVVWEIVGRLLRVGFTGTLQFLIASASWIVLMRIIALFGSEAVAGYTIAIRLIIFTILPSWGLANAAATLVGQNLGAGQPERAETSVWRSAFYNMLFLFTVSLVYIFGATPILGLFNEDPEVLQAGILSIRIISLGYIFFAYGMVISQAFNGAGDTRTPTIINFFCFWMLEIPLGYFLAVQMNWELAGVCAAVAFSETVMAIVCILVFRRGWWKTVEI